MSQGDSLSVNQLAARAKALEAELQQARRLQGHHKGPRSTKDWLNETANPIKEDEDAWFVTYLDMMTLLLVLMLVMLAFAGNSSGSDGKGSGAGGSASVQANGVATGGGAVGEGGAGTGGAGSGGLLTADGEHSGKPGRSLADLGLDGLGDDIDVLLNDQSVSFRINSEILFPSGQADLSLAGMGVLRKLSHVLNQNIYPIAVEGHTDSIPMRSSRYPSNWELSGARAGSVVRYFEANGVAKDRLRAVGYADTRPIADNASATGRASNRRVELVMDIPAAKP
ncbi:flagellar motor protein [Alcaligenaceae bacterium 429]|uniref:OmpA/MotB family protein n=1 Tax=Paenalcaligenes sp. Me52 TaxID=3392038 RepID=UPI001092BA5F|nr:flagellar motor protein [Alcaligenaceae bacterium 429]